MRKAFKASRLIGLLALLAGFMAFGASAAQAEGTWLAGGTAITGNTPVQAVVDVPGTLLTKSGLSKVDIKCEEIKFVGANLEVGGLGSGQIHFAKCETYLNTVLAGKCTPHSPGDPEGLIQTNALHGSLRLHETLKNEKGEVVDNELFELLPKANAKGEPQPFVVLQLGTGECSIGNNIPITGTVFLKDSNNKGLTDLVQHLFAEGPLSKLFFGANAATIDGSAFGFLTSGATFAGHV